MLGPNLVKDLHAKLCGSLFGCLRGVFEILPHVRFIFCYASCAHRALIDQNPGLTIIRVGFGTGKADARNERFREHNVFRRVFERVVASCIRADLVGGKGFAVDASLIAADANKCGATPGEEWSRDIDPVTAERAVRDYLANLDNPAWGAASDVVPKFVAPADPAAQWTGALRNAAFFAYADNYLIDVKFGIIMDVEASRAIRQAEVGASQTMIKRTEATFGIKPDWLVADTAYGSAPNLHFLVDEKDIAPHIPVIDKSGRADGTLSRDSFAYDAERDCYVCPQGAGLTTRGTIRDGHMLSYLASANDCRLCPLKPKCCASTPQRKVTRSIYEPARDVARAIAKTAAYEQTRRDRKKVEMLFAHLKRVLRMGRLRLRGPAGAQFEFTLAAIAQNLRRLAKLALRPPDMVAPRVA